MFKSITIDTEQNKLLCSTGLVGKGELVEVFAPDDQSPPQTFGRILQKVEDPNIFAVYISFDSGDAVGRRYELGDHCIFRILKKNLSGKRRRKFAREEAIIVDLEKGDDFQDRKINRAKTGSVRRSKPKSKKK